MSSIDKFGRTIKNVTTFEDWLTDKRSALPLTDDGDYDIQGRKICNVLSPVGKNDCANKEYVDGELEKLSTKAGGLEAYVNNLVKEVTTNFKHLDTKLTLSQQTIRNLRTSHTVKLNNHEAHINSNENSIAYLKKETLNSELILIDRIVALEKKVFGSP